MTKPVARTAVLASILGATLLIPIAPAGAVTLTGFLDRTFSGDGKVLTNVTGDDVGQAMAVQADGKIVVAGSSSGGTDIAVVRYRTNGTLDPTFGGGDGKVVTNIVGDDAAFGVAIQTDQKILVTGASNGFGDAVLLRYDTDGTLDGTFGGGDGIATTSVGMGAVGFDVAVQPDDAIVVAGATTQNLATGQALVLRYDSSGVLDGTFGGGDGIVTDALGAGGGNTPGLALQPDGGIVIAGTSVSTNNENVVVLRYDSSGDPDATFGGGDGQVTTDVGPGPDEGSDVALQGDGKIVVAGSSNFAKGEVVRYDADGTLDTTFSGDGKVFTALGQGGFGGFSGIAIQPNGKILAVGTGVLAGRSLFVQGFALVRYTTGGALDTAFSRDGKVLTPFTSGFGGSATANGVALQTDGKALVVGTVAPSGKNGDIAVARYSGRATGVIPRPDLLLGSRGHVVGGNRYNRSGFRQSITREVAPGNSVTLRVEIQNDGNTADTFSLVGSPGTPGVDVNYIDHGVTITRSLQFGQHREHLAPGASTTITMVVRVRPAANPGLVRTFKVSATSTNDPSKEDTVAARIRVLP
jgi:uncharacterized delta-60 repeat protein